MSNLRFSQERRWINLGREYSLRWSYRRRL